MTNHLSVCVLPVQGMEVYSTVLWHLKREVDLSYLAQTAVQLDRRSPHAWAIVGNCFSLQKVIYLKVHKTDDGAFVSCLQVCNVLLQQGFSPSS